MFIYYNQYNKFVNTKLLVVGKLLADGELLVGTNLFYVRIHLVDTKHLASMKM